MIQVQGVIVSQYQPHHSHWTADHSLAHWLQEYGVPALTGIDTRALTKKLRSHGVMLGQIVVGKQTAQRHLFDPNTVNVVAQVSCRAPEWYGTRSRKHIILVDCGVKLSIIRNFVQRGIRVKRVPWDYNYLSELNEAAGIVISNGPGDPMQCQPTIQYARTLLRTNKPFFGICLGSQIQGLAAGAKTFKLPYGHRSQNQPCREEGTERAVLTSQNHGFAVMEKTLPRAWRIWYRNANDGSVEGIHHRTKPFCSVQFHPEASPGPTDANQLFNYFVSLL